MGLFWRVATPVAKQAVALVFFFAFVADWTNYFLPLVMLPTSAAQTVSVGLQELITSSQLFNASAAAGLNVQLYMPELAFAAVLQMLPVLGCVRRRSALPPARSDAWKCQGLTTSTADMA